MLKLESTFDKYFMPFKLGRAAHDTLQEFIDIDVTAEDLARILSRNQVYRDLFHRFVQQKSAKQKKEGEEKANEGTHRVINLLGMIGSRNLIVATRMHRVANGKLPLTAEGTVDLNAKDYLKLASDYEELFQRNKLDYSETAFASACYFDWFRIVFANNENFKSNEDFFAETWRKATRLGLIAYFLAGKLKGVNPKFALAAGVLLHTGKLHMSLAMSGHTPYKEFMASLDTSKKLPILARHRLEQDKYSTCHEEWGAYSLRFFDVFAALAPSIRFYREPYCLKRRDKGSYLMAVMLGLAEGMANSWKIPADEKDPAFAEWSTPWTKELKLKSNQLIDVMKQAMATV